MSQRNRDLTEEEYQQRYAEQREADTQAGDDETPREWFEKIVTGRIIPCVDLHDSELVIWEIDHTTPKRYRLGLRHEADAGRPPVDLSPALDAGEFESWLRGYAAALGGEIENHADMMNPPGRQPDE